MLALALSFLSTTKVKMLGRVTPGQLHILALTVVGEVLNSQKLSSSRLENYTRDFTR